MIKKSILPNLITLLALLCSFLSLTSAIKGYYYNSCIFIFISILLDGLDGRLARFLKSQNAFGEQLDSIADMVSFGVTPAIIIYMYQLQYIGIIGHAVSFIYCACAAVRLALFNTLIGKVDKKWFIGMPSPTAAGLVVIIILIENYPFYVNNNYFNFQLDFIKSNISNVSLIITLFVGLSMISPVRFYSFKVFNKKVIYPTLFLIILGLILTFNPPLIIFLFLLIYSFSGYISFIYKN